MGEILHASQEPESLNFRTACRAGIYYVGLVLIFAFSVFNYFPAWFKSFNSDNAIHALMANDFSLPRDYYYWGQDRLGSLLPAVAHGVQVLLGIHPLLACSLVQYAFLLFPTLLLLSCIQSRWLKAAFFVAVFLPPTQFNYLLYIGHPYAGQYVCGVFSLACFLAALRIVASPGAIAAEFPAAIAYLLLFNMFFALGIWVSEFNVVLAVIPAVYVVRNFRAVLAGLGADTRRAAALVITQVLALAVAAALYHHVKSTAPRDALYDSAFFFDAERIHQEFGFLAQDIASVFNTSAVGLVCMGLPCLACLLVILPLLVPRRYIPWGEASPLVAPLLATALVSCVLLFFSTWNLRSEYSARYHIPVYVTLVFALVLLHDRQRVYPGLRAAVFILVAIPCFTYTWYTTTRRDAEGPVSRYGDFATLPRGTLVGMYWDTYLICSVANQLKPLPYDDQFSRSNPWRDEMLSETNFYFLNTEAARRHGLGPVVQQYGATFVRTGKSYRLKSHKVWVYVKAPAPAGPP